MRWGEFCLSESTRHNFEYPGAIPRKEGVYPSLYILNVPYGSLGAVVRCAACLGLSHHSWPPWWGCGEVCWGSDALGIRICWNINLIRRGVRGCKWYMWLWSGSAWAGCPHTVTGSVWWMLAHMCRAGTWHLPWPCRAETLCRRCHWIRAEAGGLSVTYTAEMPPHSCSFFSPINIYFCPQSRQNLFFPASPSVAITLWLLKVLLLAGFGTFWFSNVSRLLSIKGWKMTFPLGMLIPEHHILCWGIQGSKCCLSFVPGIVWGAGGTAVAEQQEGELVYETLWALPVTPGSFCSFPRYLHKV